MDDCLHKGEKLLEIVITFKLAEEYPCPSVNGSDSPTFGVGGVQSDPMHPLILEAFLHAEGDSGGPFLLASLCRTISRHSNHRP